MVDSYFKVDTEALREHIGQLNVHAQTLAEAAATGQGVAAPYDGYGKRGEDLAKSLDEVDAVVAQMSADVAADLELTITALTNVQQQYEATEGAVSEMFSGLDGFRGRSRGRGRRNN